MIIENDVVLGKKTTFGVGGICKKFYIPESTAEAIDVIKKNPEAPLLAAGSNIIISDKHDFPCVISVMNFNDTIENLGNGLYKVGASVRNQKLIKRINSDGYGGIEYLYYVPGSIGGAVYMNAGTGKALNNFISQHVKEVEWFDGQTIRTLNVEECHFSYRDSIFQHVKGLIVSTTLLFSEQTYEESQKLIEKRKERVSLLQDHSGRTCGTLCKKANKKIMAFLKLIRFGKKQGVHFSGKTPNWLINNGSGTFEQVEKCIKMTQKLHSFLHAELKLEVEIWE